MPGNRWTDDRERAMIVRMVETGLTASQIAYILDRPGQSVSQIVHRERHRIPNMRMCEQCGQSFDSRGSARYCSTGCKKDHWRVVRREKRENAPWSEHDKY